MEKSLSYVTEEQSKQLNGLGFDWESKPSVALALKWVRDAHQIYIRPYRQWIDVHRPDNKYAFEIDDLNNRDIHKNYESWEAAESRGLTLALNRIENRQ